MSIIVSILVLGVLIFVHELGHFLLAKANGIGVYEFSIGFGKKLWRRRIGDTWYALGAVPLGGYVSMAGEDPSLVYKAKGTEESGEEASEEEEVDELAQKLMADEQAWFLKKPYFAKLSVVVAGPGFNFLFAVIVSILSYLAYGAMAPVDKPVIGDVVQGLAAEKAGLKARDIVRSINGTPMESWIQIADTVAASQGRELSMEIERPGDDGAPPQQLSINVAASLDYQEYAVVKGEKNDRYRIGIAQSTERKEIPAGEAVINGVLHVWNLTEMTVRGLVGMIEGAISPKHIAGPLFIFKTAADTAKKGAEALLSFMVFLSVSLAVLNLLPIPVLDGGHILFFTIEAIIRRPVSLRVQQAATQIGLAFLLLLTLFALGNDIKRMF